MNNIIAKLHNFINSYEDGEYPVNTNIYSNGSTCPSCGMPVANDKAWKDLQGGHGTNLCWGDCSQSQHTLTLTLNEAKTLIHLLHIKYERPLPTITKEH